MKEKLNIEGLTAEKALAMLNGFDYPLAIDKKGRLSVECKHVYIFLSFKEKKDKKTEIVMSGSKWKSLLVGLTAGIFMTSLIMNEQQNAFSAVINALSTQKKDFPINDITSKIKKLNELKEQGLISEDEYSKEKNKLLEKL